MKKLPPVVCDFIASARVCRIATVRENGEPHVIPVCPVFDGATLFIDLGPASVSAKALAHEQRIAVAIDEYNDDWSKLRKVILKCTAERVTGAAQEAAWALIRDKYPQSVGYWDPRQTMALNIYAWAEEGLIKKLV